MSADSLSEKAKQLLGPALAKLVRGAPPAVVRDLVVGLACRQPSEVVLEIVQLLSAYLPDAELQQLLTEATARVRDPAALLPPAVGIANRFESQAALLRELADHGPSIPRETALHVVDRSMRTNDSLECFRLAEGLRRLALEHQSTVDHVLEVYVETARAAARLGCDLRGARVLELGPGHSLLGGVLLLLLGADCYHAVDPFPVAQLSPVLFHALRERLAAPGVLTARDDSAAAEEQSRLLARFDDLVHLGDDRVEWDREALQLHAEPAEALSLGADGFDLVCSNAVLEHVRDLESVAAECARVLKPGGLTLHKVDYRDHRSFSQPWEFLTLSPAEWAALLANSPFEYTNRRRHSDVVEAFTSLGLNQVEDTVTDRRAPPPELHARLAREFRARSADDLEILSARVGFTKPTGC